MDDIVFLHKNVFHSPAFAGQKINLFSPDSQELKDKLQAFLEASYSSENLSFLEDIYNLNSAKDLSPEKSAEKLREIEKQYINPDAVTSLNIQQRTLKKIRNNTSNSLAVYEEAVKEVFDLINTNITKHATALSELQTKLIDKKFNKVSEELSQGYNAITKLTVTKSGGLNIFSPQSNESRFEACRDICKKAQRDLNILLKNPGNKLNSDEREIQFREISKKVIERLSENFQKMQQYESKNPGKDKLSQHIEKMIVITSAADAKLIEDKIVTMTPKLVASKTRVSESSKTNSLHTPEVSVSRESSASLSSIRETSTLPKEYKPSSRAEANVEVKTDKTENDDSGPKRPRR